MGFVWSNVFNHTPGNSFDSTRFGLEIGFALQKLYPGKIDWDVNRFLIGNHAVIQAGKDGADPRTVLENMRDGVEQFVERRRKYLIYKVVKGWLAPPPGLLSCGDCGLVRCGPGFSLRLVLAPWRAPAPLDSGHPGRWPATALAPATCQALQGQDCFFNVLKLLAEFR